MTPRTWQRAHAVTPKVTIPRPGYEADVHVHVGMCTIHKQYTFVHVHVHNI